MQHQIKIQRVYEKASLRDGARFLVDRLWPRGVLEHNNAVALQKFLQRRLRKRQKRRSSVPTSRMKQERKTQK